MSTWGNWMRQRASASPTDPYWIHVALIFNQMEGLVLGHNAMCRPPCAPLQLVDILLLSPSVMDIITVCFVAICDRFRICFLKSYFP